MTNKIPCTEKNINPGDPVEVVYKSGKRVLGYLSEIQSNERFFGIVTTSSNELFDKNERIKQQVIKEVIPLYRERK